jgi:transcription factor IIIB 90 kDa subunit
MTRGRRPAGICGAALLLAARMNNFRRSIEEIVQVVKIADTTLKKRLEEFKATPSGALTLADFRNVWLEDEMDPPAFTKGKEKEEAQRMAVEEGERDEEQASQEANIKGKKAKEKKKRKGKRKRIEEDTVVQDPPPRQPLDPSILSNSILTSALTPPDEDLNIDPALLQQSIPITTDAIHETSSLTPTLTSLMDETLSSALAEEVTTFLQNSQGTMLVEALNEAEQRRLAQMTVDDELLGLNEEELDRFILNEEEVRIKERVWVELNKEYLEAIAGKTESSFLRNCVFWKERFAQRMFFAAKGDQESTSTTKSRKVRISLMTLSKNSFKKKYHLSVVKQIPDREMPQRRLVIPQPSPFGTS